MQYETRYVHKIAPSEKDVGPTVDIEPTALESKTKLAAALRNTRRCSPAATGSTRSASRTIASSCFRRPRSGTQSSCTCLGLRRCLLRRPDWTPTSTSRTSRRWRRESP